MGNLARISVRHVTGAQFEARNTAGQTYRIVGPPDLGSGDEGLRPMEMLLASLAGCSAVDVLHILRKGRHSIEKLELQVEGERADGVPAVYTKIHLRFVGGGVAKEKLLRAAELSVNKYCSVSRMLESSVSISYEVVVED